MNSEYPAIETANSAERRGNMSTHEHPRRQRLLLPLLIAFAGGIAATLWAAPRIGNWWNGTGEEQASTFNDTQALLGGEGGNGESSAQVPNPSLDVATLEARLAAVSAKLDAISEQAAGAGGNAARAEGLLIAFAVRRALDRGSPLGYLEGELRLRFGDSQPRAVATIVNAAAKPVTIADLQAGLDDVSPELLGSGEKVDWWTATRREIANLIIIRKADEPSPLPHKAIERAKLMMSAGRIDAAIKEIELLPDHDAADNWLQMARQYNEARRALDVVEAAAILEPRSIPVSSRAGGPTNMQVAPPPPVVPTVKPAE